MATMSLGLELAIFGNQIPFIIERHYRRWPEWDPKSKEQKTADKWDTLALLLELHNDSTVRKILRKGKVDIIRIETHYRRGGHAQDHDYLVASGVVDELVRERCLDATPKWGYTDRNELKLNEVGMRALIQYLETLP